MPNQLNWVATMGELCVEIMRPGVNLPLSMQGVFLGPYPSGAPAIFIDAVAKLGLSAKILGCVGDDAFGRCELERLQADGVDVSGVQTLATHATGVAFVTYQDTGDREFLFHLKHAAAGQLTMEYLKPAWVEGVRWLHLNGSTLLVNEAMGQVGFELAHRVKAQGGMVTFDPNVRPELFSDTDLRLHFAPLLTLCDYVIPSQGEAEAVTGAPTLAGAIEHLLGLGVQGVVCKRGAHGATVYTRNEEISVPAFQIEAVDPTGAGDCFSAGVGYGLLQGWDWRRTLTWANAMGALATLTQGPMEGTHSSATIHQFIQQQPLVSDYNGANERGATL